MIANLGQLGWSRPPAGPILFPGGDMVEIERRLLRRAEVETITGLSRSAIYDRLTTGEFPAPVRLGRGVVRWRSDELVKWIDGLPKAESDEVQGEAED